MAEVPGNLPVHAGLDQTTYSIADGRIEVRPTEYAAYIDGVRAEGINGRQFQVLSLVAARPGSLVRGREIREEVWGHDDPATRSNMPTAVNGLQEGLGPVLGHPENGAIRLRPFYGVWAAKTLAHNGVIPRPEADSPVRVFADDRLAVYPDQAVVLRDGEVMDLTPTEYDLIAELARRPGRKIGVPVLREVSGVANKNALERQISNLRKKLGEDLGHPRRGAIVTKDGGFVGQRTVKPA